MERVIVPRMDERESVTRFSHGLFFIYFVEARPCLEIIVNRERPVCPFKPGFFARQEMVAAQTNNCQGKYFY